VKLFAWLGTAKAPHLDAGQRAEDAVLGFLERQGLRLLARNYRCRQGEIDLVMRDGAVLAFVEVRYRADERFGGALASVNSGKRKRIIAAARHYLASQRVDSLVRFDVAGVSPSSGKLDVQWIKDAFRVD
jgi:putative endonuclease